MKTHLIFILGLVGTLFLKACCKDKGPNEDPTIELVSPQEGAVYPNQAKIRIEGIFIDDSKCRATCKVLIKTDTSSIYYFETENSIEFENTELNMIFGWENTVIGNADIQLLFEALDYESNKKIEKTINIKTQ